MFECLILVLWQFCRVNHVSSWPTVNKKIQNNKDYRFIGHTQLHNHYSGLFLRFIFFLSFCILQVLLTDRIYSVLNFYSLLIFIIVYEGSCQEPRATLFPHTSWCSTIQSIDCFKNSRKKISFWWWTDNKTKIKRNLSTISVLIFF